MTASLFMFLAKGVATNNAKFREGARHALMLFGSGSNTVAARSAAISGAEGKGWRFVEVSREKVLDSGPSAIADPTLRTAAEDAVREGHAIVVYADELPLDG
ncbi:hypothetical protein [Sphingomonas immobilis]|uniref:Uncharacterized protein n=1 Tax=Sphingomonas immobilis TaxID=3063997 RepID=A0ABT8ZYC4_9SPHN|nr:hypothetical protein [Sphingomonas sp. CA1-15]MDO7842580.1 hypothetical protein [Sphingomonas sp. CA1-15]